MSIERELLKRVWASERWDIPEDLQIEIKELLAQPEPEPEAWVLIDKETGIRIQRVYKPEKVNKDKWELYPLYSAPPKREPLSDATIAELWGDEYSGNTTIVRNFTRAIEKAHGIGD